MGSLQVATTATVPPSGSTQDWLEGAGWKY
jgi:hypothetical protein